VQPVIRVLRALLLLGSVWGALSLIGWATGAMPPSPVTSAPEPDAEVEAPADAATAPEPPPADAAVAPADAAPEGPPPLPGRTAVRFTACSPDSPAPLLAVLRIVGDPRPEVAVGCGPLVQLLMAQRSEDGAAITPVRVVALEANQAEPGTRTRATAAAADDVDGDSTPDLVLGFVHEGPEGDPRGGALYVVRGHPTGAFEAPQRLAPIAAVSLATAPLDDSPGADVVALHQASLFARRPSEVWVFSGGPAPARRAQLRTGVGGEALAVADLDRDGHLDLVAVAGEAQRVDVFFGDGGGRFPRSTTLELAGGREAVTGDLTGDGQTDVLVVGQALVRLDYESKETLRAEPVAAPEGFGRIRVVDVDGDGRSDLVGLVPKRGALWMRHTGEPLSFEEAELLTFDEGAFEVHAVEVTDLDANGQLDAVVLGRTGEGAPWELLLLSDLGRGAHLTLPSEPRPIPDAPLTLQVPLQ
jgi:hypothetical protein